MREEHRLLFGPASEDAHGVSDQAKSEVRRSDRRNRKRPVHLLNGPLPS
jgi:hypothetical protein